MFKTEVGEMEKRTSLALADGRREGGSGTTGMVSH